MYSILFDIPNSDFCVVRCGCGRLYKRKKTIKYRLNNNCIDCSRRGKNNQNYKHGLANKTRLYSIWKNIKKRCNNKSDPRYVAYGGRGIRICKDWQNNFLSFFNWANQNGYSDNLSIDRINNDGNYCPENCRWVSMAEQQYNTTRSRKFLWKGKMLCMKQIADMEHKKYDTVKDRVRAGWSIYRAIYQKTKGAKDEI